MSGGHFAPPTAIRARPAPSLRARLAPLRLRTLLTAALLRLGGAPAAPAATSADASYVVSLGGNIIANAKFHFVDDGSAYSLSLDANVSGVAQLVASGTARVDSAGGVTGGGLRSNSFDLTTRSGGDEFNV